jgi:hydroxyacylglutathione hydrolase
MSQLELRQRQVGPWGMNTYALVCPDTNESVLIDPGADPSELEKMLEGTNPIAILLTHTHEDHIGALAEMRTLLGVPVMAHPGPHVNEIEPAPERSLNKGDTVKVGNHSLRVYYAPGHAPDQICFELEGDERFIVGDTLFEGGPGKTWSHEDFLRSLRTLREVVMRWPDDTICYPGHGPSFRIGDLRDKIDAFQGKDFPGFYGDASWDM